MTPSSLIFDINETLLDMTAVKHTVARLTGSEDAVPLWFSTLLHHSLVENSTDRFHNFSDIGAAALVMVCHARQRAISMEEAKGAIVPAMTSLPAHKEVKSALQRLRKAGFTLTALSNSASAGLQQQLQYADIAHAFDHVLSVEQIGIYKPNSAAYRWAVKQIGTPAGLTMMVAAHGWDTTGAKAAGLQAAFVSRPGKMPYPLGIDADITVKDIAALAAHLGA